MTLSSAMILVDQTSVPLAIPDAMLDLDAPLSGGQWILTANMLPLAAFMVLGGRLGDIHGLRLVFLVGAALFAVSSALAGFAQDLTWMIAARASQGVGAALMMPVAVAIVSATQPQDQRGRALGLLAGFAAFAAALGPVVGGGLASIDWRLVFLINVPLAIAAIALTRANAPALRLNRDAPRHLDLPGVTTFSIFIVGMVYGLGQGQPLGWTDPQVLGSLAAGLLGLVAFVFVEHRVENPMIEFRLFRHLNFLAANVSQFLGGAIELGTAFLLPYFLLMMIGLSPIAAGVALIPATVPIIIAGPLAGKAFDKVGGRGPLVTGFLFLAASGIALAVAVSEREYIYLVPGLILQGIGLGIVLTVNDPTGLNSVPEKDQGQAAGVINTSEQLGGAVGIAGLSAILIGISRSRTEAALMDRGIHPTPEQIAEWRQFLLTIEQKGLHQIDLGSQSNVIKVAIGEVLTAHVAAYEAVFATTAGIAFLAAFACLILARKDDRVSGRGIFSRRSRWSIANTGRTPGLTRHPPAQKAGGETSPEIPEE